MIFDPDSAPVSDAARPNGRLLVWCALALTLGACRTPIEPRDTGCQPVDEIPYDGVDQDCDGEDLVDVDGDGHVAAAAGGDDCDDESADVYPGAVESWYDGVDQDCDEASDYDQDGDGSDSDQHGGLDCDDTDASVRPGEEEQWYDGVDQDCDGLSDYDQDGDGFDSDLYAGDDCDDLDDLVWPGAAEVPYDGVDQDCDGADLTDVDGDGFEAMEVGGEDCDDNLSSAYPGAPELPETSADEDCDGFVDEWLVCPDGSGSFTSIQSAVDAVPDGSAIELCAGTYGELVTIEDKQLAIYGGAEHPSEVVLDGHDGAQVGFIVSGSAADVTLHWLTVQAGEGAQPLSMSEDATVVVDTVDFCGEGWEGNTYLMYVDSPSDSWLSITGSRFCGTAHTALSGHGEIVGNVFEDVRFEFWADLDPDYPPPSTSWRFANNIVMGSSYLYFTDAGTHRIENNVFVDISRNACMKSSVQFADAYMQTVYIENNIFADLPNLSDALWFVHWLGYYDSTQGRPASFTDNLYWNLGGPLGVLEHGVWDGFSWQMEVDDSMSTWMAARSSEADPMFSASPERGSFDLDPSSPAIDAGTGDPDPDGSINDIGAFGGPNGDWWEDYPWPLP
jgi:hypothetical protein